MLLVEREHRVGHPPQHLVLRGELVRRDERLGWRTGPLAASPRDVAAVALEDEIADDAAEPAARARPISERRVQRREPGRLRDVVDVVAVFAREEPRGERPHEAGVRQQLLGDERTGVSNHGFLHRQGWSRYASR